MSTPVQRWMMQSRRWFYGCAGILLVVLSAISWFWTDFCLWRADLNLAQRNHAVAEFWIERSRWGRNPDPRACLIRLRLARRLGRYNDVEKLLLQATASGVPAADIRREQWLAMAQTEQFDQISPYWQELLSDPRDDEPEIARAYVIWASSRDQIETALHVLDLWIQDYPHDSEPFAMHGQIAQALNNDQGAVDAYRKALVLAPHNYDYRLALATALRKQLQLGEAEELFQECVQANPKDLAALEGLAETYAAQGELEKAQSLLETALRSFPDELQLHRTLGQAYLAKGEDAAAIPHLERFHAAYPENADIAYGLAQALNSTKRAAEAAALFEFVAESREPLSRLKPLEEELAKHPDDLELRFQIASISAKYKSRQEAIRWLEKLLLISRHYRPAHEALAELYRLTGDPQKSTEHQKITDGLTQESGR